MSGFFQRLWNAKAPSSEKPFRDELLSVERLEDRAVALAARFTIDPSPRRRARNIFPRFDDNARFLRHAYRTLADDLRPGSLSRPRRVAARQLPPGDVGDQIHQHLRHLLSTTPHARVA
jgi:cyclic beta-1,2-glucan synthetase